MSGNDMRFDVIDYIIFALLLVFSAAIGLFYGFIDKRRIERRPLMGTHLKKYKRQLKITF
jgi:Na+/H+ antiporter NhaC